MNEMNRSAATGLDSPYADILDVPRHQSVRHAPMPLEERAALAGNMAVDAVMDSVSVKTTFR